MSDLRESIRGIFTKSPRWSKTLIVPIKSQAEAETYGKGSVVASKAEYFLPGGLVDGKISFVLNEGVFRAALVIFPNGSFAVVSPEDKPMRRKELEALGVDLKTVGLTESAVDLNQLDENNIKDWISGKVNAALLSLGADKESWSSIEDAVFSAALGGKLGDGTPSSETAQAIADMVTELAGAKAAPMPEPVKEPGPDSLEVGDEVGLPGEVSVTPPEPPDTDNQDTELNDIIAQLDGMADEDEHPEGETPEQHADHEAEETPEEEEEEHELGKETADEPAGKGKGRAELMGKSEEDFDKKALEKGTKHELEHTDDSELAKKIAMDHLAEDPKYYEKLDKLEKESIDDDLIDSLIEAPVEVPVKPVTRPTVAPPPTKAPQKPSTPIRPAPGQKPHPKALKTNDVELFRKVRSEGKLKERQEIEQLKQKLLDLQKKRGMPGVSSDELNAEIAKIKDQISDIYTSSGVRLSGG